MKKNYDLVTTLMNSILAALHYLFGGLLYLRLPDSIPLTFDFWGRATLQGPKAVLCFGVPTGFLLLFLVLEFAPKIDPRRDHYIQISGRYKTLQNIILLFFSAIFWVHIHLVLGYTVALSALIPIFAGIFLSVFGNYVITLRPNYYLGIRTPWALSSEWNWRKTHRFAGRLWVAAGIVTIFSGMIYLPATAICLLMAILAPVIYSLVLYLKYESNHTGGGES